MEREKSNFRKLAIRGVAGTLLVSFLAVGFSPHEDSGCISKVDWEGFKNISVCQTGNGRIVVQGPNTPPRVLPDGVCRLSQIWARGDKVIWSRCFNDGYLHERDSIDLVTGKTGDPRYYSVSYGSYGNGNGDCKK